MYSFIVEECVDDFPSNSSALVAKYPVSEIHKAYHKLTGDITDILETKNFKKLRRACFQEISLPTSTLPKSLIEDIRPTNTLDDMLDVLALSPYWNWFDTRLLQAVVSASGSPEAEMMLEQFKQIHYAHKVSEVLPCTIVRPIEDAIIFTEKFNKDPKELTLLDLRKHKQILEYEVMDIGENKIVLSCIRTGCVELLWLVPLDLVHHAYTSIKKNQDKLSLLAVESLVCKEADKIAGLPILWCGQEVGEVGPIVPLPERVRQEPYSLPQGFHWVTLSDVEEIVKFMNEYGDGKITNSPVKFMTMHPDTKNEWQFGIKTTNGKIVGIVLAYPASISIKGVSLTCIRPYALYHPKYNGKQMLHMLNKEVMRRANLYSINYVLAVQIYKLCKPISTVHLWRYKFDHPSNSLQLPSSPRTPGWRRMTSEDVPSALALINKWSSQFEIRQVFNSEEEFAHIFLCPTMKNVLFTYVVENKTNKITDLVAFVLLIEISMQFHCFALVSTQSPVKQLITDALVCAKENGATELLMPQRAIKSEILSSLSFQYVNESTGHLLYNYRYYKVPPSEAWYL